MIFSRGIDEKFLAAGKAGHMAALAMQPLRPLGDS